jgi:hypothetical protein
MKKRKIHRPSPGLVLGALALAVALAGNTGALAGTKVTKVIVHKGQIAKGAVTARNLAPGAVRAAALAEGSVTAAALKDGAVGPSALAPGAVRAAAIADGAVRADALAGGAVGAGALAPGSVGPGALAPDAVSAGALAPGSVYGGALGAVTLHTAAIADPDPSADLSTWTVSSTVTAACAVGEHVISGGVVFTNPGNRRVGIIQSAPTTNGPTQGWIGQITSDSGGTAAAEVQVLCLK